MMMDLVETNSFFDSVPELPPTALDWPKNPNKSGWLSRVRGKAGEEHVHHDFKDKQKQLATRKVNR